MAFPIHVAYLQHVAQHVAYLQHVAIEKNVMISVNYANPLKSFMNFVIDTDFKLCYNVITMNETKLERRCLKMDKKCNLCGVDLGAHSGYFQSVLRSGDVLIPIFSLTGTKDEWDHIKETITRVLKTEEVEVCSNCLRLNH